jgi:hypothetical protein
LADSEALVEHKPLRIKELVDSVTTT